MCKIILTAFLLMIGFFRLSAQTKEEILTLQQKYDVAVVKKDVLFVQQLFHNDMIITGGNGQRRNKNEEIKDLTDPMYDVQSFTTKNIEVNLFENVAILRGDIEWEMKMGSSVNILKRRITFTYHKGKDGWKIIAQHIGMQPR